MIEMKMTFKNETKTCYRFEAQLPDRSFVTLYLKKFQVDDAGIDPKKGIKVTVEQTKQE